MLDSKGTAIRKALERLGIPRDGVLMVHSALRPFTRDGYSLEGILDALTDYMALGTLLLPTMSWRVVRPTNPYFDELVTPSNVGALAERFRLSRATHRSLHPTHSAAAIGRLAAELTSGHERDDTPCSDNSPFGKLAANDGFILMLGITMDCCTLVHHAEEKYAVKLYVKPKDQTEIYTCRRRTGEKVTVRLRRHFLLPRDYYQFQDMMAEAGQFRTTTLDTSVLRAFRAADLMACAERLLHGRPDAIIARPGQRYRMM
jgi:aminoglycoside 3-N-acetyltransferase